MKDRKYTSADYDDILEDSLRQVLLWDKVKDKLDHKGTRGYAHKQQHKASC